MEFINLTKFPCLAFEAIDKHDQEFHVVAMRATFDIVPDAELQPAKEQLPLAVSDEYFGETNKSSVRQESDLSPYKPKCDVILISSAYAPGGKPEAFFEASLNITTPSTITRGQIILSKKLTVTGPRFWEKRSVNNWTLTEPEPIVSLPLQYEYAYGGECRINPEDPASERVEAQFQLTPEQRQQHPDGAEKAPVAHTVYENNPVGIGFTEQWHVDATKPAEAALAVNEQPQPKESPVGIIEEISRFLGITSATAPVSAPAPKQAVPAQPVYKIPAPQIESPNDPICEFGKQYAPQGFGVITKTWKQRLRLAGTYDEKWLEEKWPALPNDFNFAYWNCAHTDMQVPYLKGNEMFELSNLTPHGALRFQLPELLVFMKADYEDDEQELIPAQLDTVVIEPDTMKASLVWRALIPASPDLASLEARMILKEDKTEQDKILG